MLRDRSLFDGAGEHSVGHDGAFDQVPPVFWEDSSNTRCTHLVAGAADSLQSTCYRRWRSYEYDEVDGGDVDAEFER
ncbi:hypothetical protein BMS3Bbin02_00865 [bacterium BMS3Bbin02]|nr:hypothetical protein BMS3Bbin02_00865 [bacterium BMS3Bbin02]